MFRVKNIPIFIVAILMLVLVFFQSWTFYLGTTDVTFERLLGKKLYKEISDISLRRYKEEAISPHLFTITTDDEKSVIEQFTKDCSIQKITFKKLPLVANKVDKEMVEVIEKSPYIYLSKSYDLQNPKGGRMCLVFRDKEHLYLFINGNL
jgi:hypothetical protein